MVKAPYRIHQVSGHQGNITCLHLPRKAALIFSGGEDRAVNVWKIGSPSRICEFPGGQSAIECLTADENGKIVYAGSQGGSIKSFSVDGEKALRAYSGHLSSCTCVDLSSVQEILASGSLDTNVKVWDRRQKAAVNTSKSHDAEITCVKFCPSEHQLLSGAKDGSLMIWDLRKSRNAILEYHGHTADIIDVAFHPVETFFVSSSADKTVKCWDTDDSHFESSTAVDTNQTKKLCFLDDSREAVGASNDGVKLFLTEPSIKCYKMIDVGWNSVANSTLSIEGKELIGAGFYGSFITAFAVPLLEDRKNARPKTPNAIRVGASDTVRYVQASSRGREGDSRPKTNDNNTDARPRTSWAQRDAIDPTIPSSSPGELSASGKHCTIATSMSDTLEKMSIASSEDDREMISPPEYYPDANARAASAKPLSDAQQKAKAKNKFQVHTVLDSKSVEHQDKYRVEDRSPNMQETLKNMPMGLDFQKFVPDDVVSMEEENSIIAEVTQAGSTFTTALTNRLGHLRVIASFWKEGNPQGAIMHIQQFSRPARDTIVVDFLNAVDIKKLDLDCCALILPLATSLLNSEFRSHVSTALTSSSQLLRVFSPIIKSTQQYAQNSRDVDISREERLRKCQICYDLFRSMYEEMMSLRSNRLHKAFGSQSETLISQLKDFL